MQGGQGQVAGLGDGQGRADGFLVPHLTDEDHVRILAQHVFQGVGKTLGVAVDFALVDDALLVLVHELDGILDGDDMPADRRC